MRSLIGRKGIWLAVALVTSAMLLAAQERPAKPSLPNYRHSLHYTNQGLQHWYAKENGGLERLTGIPFAELASCNGCHVRTCDACHGAAGGAGYAQSAQTEKACDKCHDMESRTFAAQNPRSPAADVHFARGMKCMACHSSRELHGDGTQYASMQSPGAMDARCENCHKDLAKCRSNAVHHGRVDCAACHTREVSSCYNCHFDTKVKDHKSVSLPLKGALFLVNHEGKVTAANLHTFIYQNRTLIVFAPAFPHWIVRQGRQCGDCHGTPTVRALQAGSLKAVTWDKGKLSNVSGVIPVVDGYRWNFPFLNYAKGQWVPATEAAPPLLNYSGYAQPITKEQLQKMAQPQKRR